MWKLLLGKKLFKRALGGGSRGATLIEVVIAVVVLGLLVAAIPTAMVVVINAQTRQNEVRVAESLTRSELEYIKAQNYRQDCLPYSNLGDLETYTVRNEVYCIDQNHQQITVMVYRNTSGAQAFSLILETTGLKVYRSLDITGYEVTQ